MLGRQQIIHGMMQGSIIIHPYNVRNLGSNSYDVRLGKYYYTEQVPNSPSIDDTFYNMFDAEEVDRVWGARHKEAQPVENIVPESHLRKTNHLHGRLGIILAPGESILAHTEEFIGGRNIITSMMKARSSYGRNFITVCRCAGLGDVGYFNRWTMEITNNSRYRDILLLAGMRVGQITFFEAGDMGGFTYGQDDKYQAATELSVLMRDWHPSMMKPKLHLDWELQKAAQ